MSTTHGGMVVYHFAPDGEIKFLLMTPTSDGQPKVPQISKGKREGDEKAKETAKREAKEELGLTKDLMRDKPEKLGKFGNDKIWCVETSKPEKFKTKDRDEVSSIEWLTMTEFKKRGWKDQLPILEAAEKKILGDE